MTLGFFEEIAWRGAGRFTEQDFQAILKMYSVGRNKDYVDRSLGYYERDIDKLRTFMMGEVNNYDDRNKLLEKWLTNV